MRRFGMATALGAALAWFFDPRSGARRRNETRDRVLAFFRRGQRRAEQAGRGMAAEAYGMKQKVTHLQEEPKEFDDVTLARKVETEIFRDPDVPKGQINVNAEDGRVYLRGEVPTGRDESTTSSRRQRQVEGVREVESLLHAATPSMPQGE